MQLHLFAKKLFKIQHMNFNDPGMLMTYAGSSIIGEHSAIRYKSLPYAYNALRHDNLFWWQRRMTA